MCCLFFSKSREKTFVSTLFLLKFFAESNDVPATSIFFSKDQHSMLMGFENGSVRVYPMKEKIEIFDLELLSSPYWQLNMHDNDTGPYLHNSVCI